MIARWKKTRRKAAAARPAAQQPTAWSRFLDHAMDCPDCRNSERCSFGDRLHRAARAALDAATP